MNTVSKQWICLQFKRNGVNDKSLTILSGCDGDFPKKSVQNGK